MDIKRLKINQILFLVILIFFLMAVFLPTGQENEMINTILGVAGLLFAILIGFFITDLWTRSQKIRDNVAVEVSGLQTYYLFVKIMARFPGHKEWARRERELIDNYVRKFFEVEWNDYGKIDPYFNKIIESLKEVGELKTNNEVETYTNMLPLLNEITTSREKMFMYGKDKLSKAEWIVVLSLASILLFSMFYLNTGQLSSIILTGTLSSAVAVLLLILRDLNNLSYGEEMVSFEPYETIFDVIGKPRFYLKKDIKSGRVSPPKGSEYRTD